MRRWYLIKKDLHSLDLINQKGGYNDK
jgi:hypothetical protein